MSNFKNCCGCRGAFILAHNKLKSNIYIYIILNDRLLVINLQCTFSTPAQFAKSLAKQNIVNMILTVQRKVRMFLSCLLKHVCMEGKAVMKHCSV